jgi:hypothetical protein
MKARAKTDKKYADFIKDCANARTFSIKAMLEKHKVDAAIITTMRQEDCIASVTADLSNWIASNPNEVMIRHIIDAHRQRITMYRLNRLKKVKEKEIQEVATRPAPKFEYFIPPTEPMTEESAVEFLKSIGGYEIYKVERKQL